MNQSGVNKEMCPYCKEYPDSMWDHIEKKLCPDIPKDFYDGGVSLSPKSDSSKRDE